MTVHMEVLYSQDFGGFEVSRQWVRASRAFVKPNLFSCKGFSLVV